MAPLCENTDCKYNDNILYEPDKHYCKFTRLNPHTDVRIDKNGECKTFIHEDKGDLDGDE